MYGFATFEAIHPNDTSEVEVKVNAWLARFQHDENISNFVIVNHSDGWNKDGRYHASFVYRHGRIDRWADEDLARLYKEAD